MKIPCENCICLPICRNRYLGNYKESRSPLSNLRILSDMCEELDDFFFEIRDTGVSDRIYGAIDLLKGKNGMTDNHPCMGCKTYEDMKMPMTQRCLAYDYKEICPCRNCLVKGICTTVCEERNNFIRLERSGY